MQGSRATLLGLLLVALGPTLLLAPSLFGSRSFVPFDLAQFAPTATTLTAEEFEQVTVDANYGPTEVVQMFVPELRFARAELEAGRLPHWNPYARFGTPLLANGVDAMWYPPNWQMLARDDPQSGLAFGAWLSLVLAGGLMFGFLRAVGLRLEAAVGGAILFALSGTLVAQAHFYQRLATLVWLPGLLWSVRATVRGHGGARVAGASALAACVGMTLLAGFPAYAVPCLLVAGIYGLGGLWTGREHGRAATLRTVGWAGAAVAVGVGLAAVQLLPMAEFFPQSGRGAAVDDGVLASQGLAPLGLLFGLLCPDLFGHPHFHAVDSGTAPLSVWLLARFDWADGTPYWPIVWNYIEGTVFVGTLTLPLALFAGLRPRSLEERACVVAVLALAVLSGGYGLLGFLHRGPGLGLVFPVRFVGPLCGVLAILAAFGLDRVLEERSTTRRRTFGWALPVLGFGFLCAWQVVRGLLPAEFVEFVARRIVAAHGASVPGGLTEEAVLSTLGTAAQQERVHALVVANLLHAGIAFSVAGVWWAGIKRAARGGRYWAAGWRWLAVAAVAVELGLLAAPLLQGRHTPVPVDSAVHDFLRGQRDGPRRSSGFSVIRATGAPSAQNVFPQILTPSQLVPERIRDVNAYTFLDARSHLVLEAIWGAEKFIKGNVWPFALPDDARLRHPYLDLLGVRWVLSEDPLLHAGSEVGPEVVGTRLRPDGRPLSFHVYERANAVPRAFSVPELRVVETEQDVIDALARQDLKPRSAAWVTRDAAGASAGSGGGGAVERSVRWVRDEVQELELEVGGSPRQSWLVLNDTWMPGWSATVGGRPAELLRVNVAMRAVAVPANAAPTTVVMRYAPPGFSLGWVVSLIALLLATAAGATALALRIARSVDGDADPGQIDGDGAVVARRAMT